MTIVYLGGPIDLVSGEQRNKWRERFADELASRRISSFNPASAFKLILQNKEDAEMLIEINKSALSNSNFAVFLMGKDMPSIGTPMELLMARQMGIPHLVIWEPKISSFTDEIKYKPLPKSLPAYIHGLADQVVYRFDDALDKIVEWERKRSSELTCNLGSLRVPTSLGALGRELKLYEER